MAALETDFPIRRQTLLEPGSPAMTAAQAIKILDLQGRFT
jgi:hypothetical protein